MQLRSVRSDRCTDHRFESKQQEATEDLEVLVCGRVIRRGNSSLPMEATVDVVVMSSWRLAPCAL